MQVFEGFEKLFHFRGRSAGVVSHRDECRGTWGKGRSFLSDAITNGSIYGVQR
jgi:hypothetical protein